MKASNINCLRAIKQQYLHQNKIPALDFEDVPAMGRPFFSPRSRVEKASQLTKCFRTFFAFMGGETHERPSHRLGQPKEWCGKIYKLRQSRRGTGPGRKEGFAG